jgi:ParB-like chromosome segregation protein Spo0J
MIRASKTFDAPDGAAPPLPSGRGARGDGPAAKSRRGGEAAPALAPETLVDLDDIVGVDPCNSRREESDDDSIEGLARQLIAHGQAHPIRVRGAPKKLLVLAGTRRWRALLSARELMAADPGLAEGALLETPIRARVRIFTGDDDYAREVSLDENFGRRDLSPLEEAERFAELLAKQPSRRLAQSFGVSERFLRQRAKLANLPDFAKAAWRRLKFSIETAYALTLGSPEKVAELVEQQPEMLAYPAAVRRELAAKGVRASSPEARFVGAEDYVAAGGEILDDLFTDERTFLDTALLKRRAAAKLARLGETLLDAEGWGHVFVGALPDSVEAKSPDFTVDESLEFLELESKLGAPLVDDAALLEARRDELLKRAALRSVAVGERGNFAIRVDLDGEGRPIIERAIRLRAGSSPPPPPGAPSPSGEDFAALAAAAIKRPPSPSPAQRERAGVRAGDEGSVPALSHAACRAALIGASRAVAQSTRTDALLALRFAVAALACQTTGPIGIRRTPGPWGLLSPEVRELTKLSFVEALERVSGWGPEQLAQAFNELVAAMVDLRDAGKAEAAAVLAVVRGRRGQNFDLDLTQVFDYFAVFRAASRGFALAVIRDLGGDRTAMIDNDEDVAAAAAKLARERSWLPDFLRPAK